VIQLKRILLPTDFSDCAQHALKYATALARSFGAKVYLLHVVDVPVYGYLEPFAGSVWSLYDMKEEAERSIADIIPPEDRDAVGAESFVREGTPFVEIVKFAKEKDIDLIVIGTHGRTGLKHMLIGSVEEKVVRKAPCPVLTVRSPGHEFVMP